MRSWIKGMCFSGVLLLGTACTSVLSEEIPTNRINATFTVNMEQGNATATAVFLHSGAVAEYVDLSGGDHVTCNGISLARQSLLGTVSYRTAIAGVVGGDYHFELHRADGTSLSSVTLPESITISEPLSGTEFPQGTAIQVSWNAGTNTADRVIVELDPAYKSAELSSLLATHTIQETHTAATNTVTRELRVSRVRTGTLSPDFHGGSIKAQQRDRISLTLVDD